MKPCKICGKLSRSVYCCPDHRREYLAKYHQEYYKDRQGKSTLAVEKVIGYLVKIADITQGAMEKHATYNSYFPMALTSAFLQDVIDMREAEAKLFLKKMGAKVISIDGQAAVVLDKNVV